MPTTTTTTAKTRTPTTTTTLPTKDSKITKRKRKPAKLRIKPIEYLTTTKVTTASRSPTPSTLPPTPQQQQQQPPPPQKPPQYFHPLTIHHATYLPSSPFPGHQPTPLQNPIHPLLRPQTFPSLPPAQYALLTPALRLASRFLTSHVTFPHLLPLLLATGGGAAAGEEKEKVAAAPPHPWLEGETCLPRVEDTYATRRAAYEVLRQKAVAREVEVRFREGEGERSGGWGVTYHYPPGAAASLDAGDGHGKGGKGNGKGKKALVFLDRRFLSVLEEEPCRGGGQAQRQRQHFHLALNLVHEIAHALNPFPFSYPSYPSSSTSSSSSSSSGDEGRRVVVVMVAHKKEPFHSPHDPAAELGSALEARLFRGGKIQPVNLDAACADGLMWFPWLSEEEEEERAVADGMSERFWGVSMAWIASVCSEDGWELLEREGRWRGVELVGGEGGMGVREPFTEGFMRAGGLGVR
ncbi:MAG: hypothetical protein Q9202_000847 [Teloschistes flavicans]